ncbi:MAG: Maf family protein [Cyanobium sp.]
MLVLASASPARRRLLEQAGIPHRVRVSGVDEAAIHHPDPLQLVQRLAAAKAEAVAAHMQRAGERGAEPVLGCDSVLEVDGEVFGKPRDREQAIERWLRMAGGRGVLHTGHCLLPGGGPGVSSGRSEPRMAVVSTALAFAAVDRAEIEAYVESGEPLQCAGGFALEGRGGLLVERIEGCFSNVIGLSLPLLRRWLSCDPP